MYTFIGGASTVTGKHDRRVNHKREKSFMMKLGRPKQLLVRQVTPDHSVQHSRAQSRTGSLDGSSTFRLKTGKIESRYGDECLSGRVSLLHFCVIFLLAGTITLTVGLVQYKPDAELFQYRQTIVILGCISFTIGLIFLMVKCACFCSPKLEYRNKALLEEKKHLNASTEFKGSEHSVNKRESPDVPNQHEMVILRDGREIADGNTESSASDIKNSDSIIQAEVEICYSA